MESKTIVIAGAAGRIGLSLANFFYKKKYNLILVDISKKKTSYLSKIFNSDNLVVYKADLTDSNQIDNVIKNGIKKFKKIDVAINCIYPKTNDWGNKFEYLKQTSLNKNLITHLGGVIIFSQRFLKIFNKMNNGNLILFSSIYGLISPRFEIYRNTRMNSPLEYSAIKSSIISITKYLAKYYKKKNIRVNCISPGGIEDDRQDKKFVKNYNKFCSSVGLMKSDDLVYLVDFLVSNNSSLINGQNIIIDDGFSL